MRRKIGLRLHARQYDFVFSQARYASQWSAYLWLEGLYADDAPDVLGVLFQVIRVESGGQLVERPERPEPVVVKEDQ